MLDLHGGLLTQQEYNQLGTIRGRMGRRSMPFPRGGVGQLAGVPAIESAGQRTRVSSQPCGRAIKSHDAHEREAAYRQALAEL